MHWEVLIASCIARRTFGWWGPERIWQRLVYVACETSIEWDLTDLKSQHSRGLSGRLYVTYSAELCYGTPSSCIYIKWMKQNQTPGQNPLSRESFLLFCFVLSHILLHFRCILFPAGDSLRLWAQEVQFWWCCSSDKSSSHCIALLFGVQACRQTARDLYLCRA